MKKRLLLTIMVMLSIAGMAQDKCYWVFFTDKNDTQFDPYTYFDTKAIERYQQCGADLYDISNYPLNSSYVNTVDGYATELFGESRWLNAIGIMATDDNALLISTLPFVKKIQEIVSNGMLASTSSLRGGTTKQPEGSSTKGRKSNLTQTEPTQVGLLRSARNDVPEDILTNQLKRFGGQFFIDKGIDGKGLRICVMDGGFPKVDTHPAFKQLRDNHQILKTYNFPNKKEDVYGWSDHGTCVLSCIAGINDKGQKLGLATGAEFILARTEIDPEPFKEEVWWAQGAEWADKNGADIINSSLGYGKDRHWTKDMDGTSYVAKAAQMAAEKGILICNSAGNEGDDEHWMTIITPGDAENVLTVGGIDANLEEYRHIYFSSYGPTADKRMKPNVVAFGEAEVANQKGGFNSVFGTSFSSPLVAGFCACAWQTHRDLTAMQMKSEIEKSADLYPYFDYAYGYGVPQAAYFTGDLKPAERSFTLIQEKDGVRISIPEIIKNEDVFFNVEGADGVLLGYYKVHPSSNDIILKNTDLGQGVKLNVKYNGYFDSCPISGMGGDIALKANNKDFSGNDGTYKKIKGEGWQSSTYFQYDYTMNTDFWNGTNSHFGIGERWLYGKSYQVGFGFGFNFNNYVSEDNGLHDKTTLRLAQFKGELLQRVIIRMWGINWDLGVYGGVNYSRRVKTVDKILWYGNDGQSLKPQPYDKEVETVYKKCKAANLFEYGATTRLSYNLSGMLNIGVYANYRLSDVITKDDPVIGPKANPSPWCIGFELEIVP
jgi:hypothetical protein